MYGGVCRGGRDGTEANPNRYRQLRAYLLGNWLSLSATVQKFASHGRSKRLSIHLALPRHPRMEGGTQRWIHIAGNKPV